MSAFADMKPEELLKATEEAAGGDELVKQHDDLIELGVEKREKQEQHESYSRDLEAREARHEAGAADYKRWEDRKAQLNEIKILEKKLPWLVYERDRLAHDQAKEEVVKCKEKLEAVLRVGGDAEKEHEDAKRLLAENKAETESHKKEMGKKQKGIAKIHEQIEKHKEEVEELTERIENVGKQAKKFKSRESKANNVIAENTALLSNTNADELKPKLKEVNAKINKLKAELGDVEKQKRAVLEDKKELLEKVKRNQKSIEKQTNFKEQAKRKLFQRDRSGNIEKACSWLEDNGDGFKAQVFDAICLHIEMKNKSDSKKVESMIPFADLQAMLAQNGEDHSKLLSSMERLKLKVNAVKDPHPAEARKPTWKLDQIKKYGFTGVVSDLFNAPDPVMRYLLYTYNLHQVPIGPAESKKHATELFEKYRISRFIAGDSMITSLKSDYGDRAVNTKDSYLKDASLLGGGASDENQIKILKDDQKRYRAQIHELETTEKELNGKDASIREVHEQDVQVRTKWRKKYDAIGHATQRIKRANSDLAALAEDIQNNERERVNYRKRLDSKGGASVQEILKMKTLVKGMVALTTAFVQLKLEEHDLTVKTRVKKLAWEDQISEQRELKEAHEKSKTEAKAKKGIARDALKAARVAIGGGDEPDQLLLDAFQLHPETIEGVEDAIREEQAKLDIVAEVDEDAIEEHKRLGKEIEKMKKSQAKFDEDYTELCENINAQKASWAPKIKAFVEQISKDFGASFERLKCTGEVKLREHEDDFKLWGIEIWVRFRGAQKMHLLEGTVQSGGEKSVSTMLYLMSLQSLTKCPFRVVDEINQGMDAKNERMIYGQVFHASENTETSQYFIISPKLLPSKCAHLNSALYPFPRCKLPAYTLQLYRPNGW